MTNAGQTALDHQTLHLGRGIQHHFPGKGRTGTDQGHISLKHIEQLRQLINGGFADKTTDPGDSGIVLAFKSNAVTFVFLLDFFKALFSVHAHGTEFVHAERRSVFRQSNLGKYGVPLILYVDNSGNDQSRDQKEQNAQCGKYNVEDSLNCPVCSGSCWLQRTVLQRFLNACAKQIQCIFVKLQDGILGDPLLIGLQCLYGNFGDHIFCHTGLFQTGTVRYHVLAPKYSIEFPFEIGLLIMYSISKYISVYFDLHMQTKAVYAECLSVVQKRMRTMRYVRINSHVSIITYFGGKVK